MPAPVAVGPADSAPAAGEIPFIVGTNLYTEAPFFTDVQTLDANSHEFVHNITPGHFLAGVVLQVSSASGALGGATLTADAPFSIISSVSIDDISGGPILYPMQGFAAAMCQKWLRPWEGDVTKRPDFSNSVNPAFTLRLMISLRDTLACLANTDARAQYRVKYTLAPAVVASNSSVGLYTGGAPTPPAVTVKGYGVYYAQPDAIDLLGHQIQQVPDGVIASRFLMHELPQIVGGNNVVRASLVGNELRGILAIIRDSTAVRKNLTDANAGAIDWRLDSRRLWKKNPSQIIEEMATFYEDLANGAISRDTGVYVLPRFRRPGDQLGEFWLQTVEQTLMQFEFSGSDLGANVPGSAELIYDSLAIQGTLPPNLEGI